jgi:hypothetical protein
VVFATTDKAFFLPELFVLAICLVVGFLYLRRGRSQKSNSSSLARVPTDDCTPIAVARVHVQAGRFDEVVPAAESAPSPPRAARVTFASTAADQFDPRSPSTDAMWWHSPLATEEEASIVKLAMELVDDDLKPLPAHAHITMLRQVRTISSSSFSSPSPRAAADLYGKALKWRRENCKPLPGGRQDVWAAPTELCEGMWARHYCQLGICIGRSRGGHPVKLERIGLANLAAINKSPGGEERILSYYQSLLEMLLTALDAESVTTESVTTESVTTESDASGRLLRMYEIFDFKGMSLRNATWPVVKFTNNLMQCMVSVYSETTVRATLINVPWITSGILNGMLRMMPARVMKRVIVLAEGEPFDILFDDLDLSAQRLLNASAEELAAFRGSSFEGARVALGSELWPELRPSAELGAAANGANGTQRTPPRPTTGAPNGRVGSNSSAGEMSPRTESPRAPSSSSDFDLVEEIDVSAAEMPTWLQDWLSPQPTRVSVPSLTARPSASLEYRGSLMDLMFSRASPSESVNESVNDGFAPGAATSGGGGECGDYEASVAAKGPYCSNGQSDEYALDRERRKSSVTEAGMPLRMSSVMDMDSYSTPPKSGSARGIVAVTPRKASEFPAYAYPSVRELALKHKLPQAPFCSAPCPPELIEVALAGLNHFKFSSQRAQLEAEWASAPVTKGGAGVTVRQLPRSDSRSLTFRIDAILDGVSARQVEHCFSPEVYSLWNKDVHSAAFLYAPTPVQGSSPRSRAEGDRDSASTLSGPPSPRGSDRDSASTPSGPPSPRGGDRDSASAPSPRGSTLTEVDLNCSCTYPVLGGMISGRGFIDVRAVSVSVADGNDPLETHYSAQQALPAHLFDSAPAAQRWAALAAADKLLLARNLPGGGSRMVERRGPDGQLLLELLFITATELHGGLPVELVNSATGGRLHALILNLVKYLQSIEPLHSAATHGVRRAQVYRQ